MNMGRVGSIAEYRESMAPSEAITFGIDIFHPAIGDDNLKVFELIGGLTANEFAENMGILGAYGIDIFGNSVYGVGGSPRYNVAVKAKMPNLFNRIDTIGNSLKKNEAVDAVAPGVGQKDPTKPLVFPIGTKKESIDWPQYLTASDNVDGDYDMKMENGKLLLRPNPITSDKNDNEEEAEPLFDFEEGRMSIDLDKVNFNEAGAYTDAMLVTVTDTYKNKIERSFTVYVYDPSSTTPPTLELKDPADFPSLTVNTDTSTVNWSDLFVKTACDINGVDLRPFVSASVEYLDVTEPGEYPVVIYVTDFTNNRTERPITVRIVK